jgi:uncharacterized protein YdeI (YjbR/CyaY-like superfamily)
METKNGVKAITAANTSEWRKWLEVNHKTEQSVWLIIFKKESGIASITYSLAVDEALCFGWIDSKPNKRDDKSFYQFFARRNPKSNWSRVNKLKVEKLLADNRMANAGLEIIEIAKQNGTWTALDDVENLIIPPDLQAELEKYSYATQHFNAFPKSAKRGILEWILNAKTDVTRQKRVNETALLANDNIRANQYRK